MYFLADGIYPAWSVFAKTISLPISENDNKYAKRHEHVRKDIERCFGVLVQKYGILQRPQRGWFIADIRTMIDCCIILHNMTIESRRVNFTLRILFAMLKVNRAIMQPKQYLWMKMPRLILLMLNILQLEQPS